MAGATAEAPIAVISSRLVNPKPIRPPVRRNPGKHSGPVAASQPRCSALSAEGGALAPEIAGGDHAPLAALQPVPQQAHVAAVCAPEDIEGVADERHSANEAVEHDIENHAQHHVARSTELARLMHDVERESRGDGVADPGHEADQRIETEADIAARQG